MAMRKRRLNSVLTEDDSELGPSRRPRLVDAAGEPNTSSSASPPLHSRRRRRRFSRQPQDSPSQERDLSLEDQPDPQPAPEASLNEAIQHSKSCFEILVNNVFLPPKLPDKAMDNKRLVKEADHYLTKLLFKAAEEFGTSLPADEYRWWAKVNKSLSTLVQLYEPDNEQEWLSSDKLGNVLQNMEQEDFVILNIRSQNAGLIIRKAPSEAVFESFEASPLADAVAECRKRLKCSFPGPRTAILLEKFQDPRTIAALSQFLASLDASPPPAAEITANTVNDSGAASPAYITHLLTGITRGIGSIKSEPNARICKRVADAVLGTERSVWRRSPFWLVVRVGLQTTLRRQTAQGYDAYKAFLIYFMSKMIQLGVREKLIAQDYLYIMGAKLARRVQKLDDLIPEFVRKEVVSAIDILSKSLKGKWDMFCQMDTKKIDWDPETLEIESDCQLQLPKSIGYISAVLDGDTSLTPEELTRLLFQPFAYVRINDPLNLPDDWNKASKKELAVRLMDIEAWVEHHIDDHINLFLSIMDQDEVSSADRELTKKAVIDLGRLFTRYFGVAVNQYEGSPENLSVAFLTGFEIWVAMEKVVLKLIPLLRQYRPEIEERELNSLVLPSRKLMQRLAKIQTYIMDREKKAQTQTRRSTLFKDTFSEASFQCLYYDNSPHHQDLREKVEAHARAARKVAKQAMKDVNKKFYDLQEQIHKMECDYTEKGRHRKRTICRRCILITECEKLVVPKHEWPLPADDEPLAKSLIFELDCPPHFAAWRDTTFKMLVNTSAILQFTETNPETKSQETLRTYVGLRDFYQDERTSGIIFASQNRGVGREGGAKVSLPATDMDIVADFSLHPRYWYFNSVGGHWVRDFFNLRGRWDKRMFSYKLPKNSIYKSLQFTLRRSDHQPNQILAIQYKCHPQLSSHEFIEYGSLRAGHRIQWFNIYKVLKGRALKLNNEEVGLLLLQASWEAGPAVRDMKNIYLRDTHRLLDRTAIIENLLRAIEEVLESVKMNWLEVVTVATLVGLTCRCLALTKGNQQATITQAMELIWRLRDISYSWVEELRASVKSDLDNDSRNDKLDYLMFCAAVCRMTYEVPEEHADYLLDGLTPGDEQEGRFEPRSLSIYLETAAIIRDNLPPKPEDVRPYFRHAIDRSTRLSHRWEKRVREFLLQNSAAIDLAIEKQWQPHERQAPWEVVGETNEHWLRTRTQALSGNQTHQISLNLLDGRILIDSIPFGRLPDEYTNHPVYERIFGGEVLVVAPSSIEGMQFETRFPMEGHKIHFALKNSELIVRSQKDGRIFELVPHIHFENDLCEPLVEEYTHWMDFANEEIQFRKLDDKWNIDSFSWKLSLLANYPLLTRFDDPKVHVVDIRSETSDQVQAIFGCLEDKSRILITCKKGEEDTREIVHIELARLNLKFSSKNKNFTCRNFSGFIVDENQDLGCFNGLANKLVLRKGDERMALVPFGDVIFRRAEELTQITVNGATSYQGYTVDKRLGRLVGNGSISSRLYQIYLHAVTSSPACQVDSLTGRTGTEEAASLLASGAVKSFQELDKIDIQYLHLISQLTPQRTFGTSTKKSAVKKGRIEQVVWNDGLSFNCQRDIFRVGAAQVIEHWMRIKRFIPVGQNLIEEPVIEDKQEDEDAAIEEGKEDKRTEEGVERGDDILLRRAACRNEVFYAWLEDTWSGTRTDERGSDDMSVFSFEDLNPIQDLSYTARDGTIQLDEDKEHLVCQLTKLLLSWTPGMLPPKIWATLKEFDVTGVKGNYTAAKLQVGGPLLKGTTGELWCGLFSICRTATREVDLYKLIFTLGTLIYRDGWDPTIVHALAAAPMIEELKGSSYKIPKGHFVVRNGFRPNERLIEDTIKTNVERFETSYIAAYPRRGNETEATADSRRRMEYNNQVSLQRGNLRQHYLDQWEIAPTGHPNMPNIQNFRLIDVEDVHDKVEDHFGKIYKVHGLKVVLDKIQGILEDRLRSEKARQQPYTFETQRTVVPRLESPSSIAHVMDEVSAPSLDNIETNVFPFTKAELSQQVEVVRPTLRQTQLQSLWRNLSGPRTSQFQREYADDLRKSIDALRDFQGNTGSKELPIPIELLEEHVSDWGQYVGDIEKAIRSRLEPIYFNRSIRVIAGQEILYKAGLWPRVTVFTLLRLLSYHSSADPIDGGWKKAIVAYGIGLRELRRAERLRELAMREDVLGFWEALADDPRVNWNAMDNPDWLLLELENNFCMRDVQAEIAKEMINPTSGKSSVMQLNMGEGKSSVIIPAVAATLANGAKLVRVVVLKPLSREMFNLLRAKLGGLCSRRIYFLPFHRGLKIGYEEAQLIRSIYKECMDDGSILLVQNEHLLSFKLLGLEKVCSEGEDVNIGVDLYRAQKWLDANSRDLLDESDEILRVNHTLVYTVGTQGPMDNQPYRWLDLLKFFDVVKAQISDIHSEFPQGFEVTPKHESSFPYLRILQIKASDALMRAVAVELVFGDAPGRQWFATINPEHRKSILKFVKEKQITDEEMAELREILRGGNMWGAALLFRGLIAHDILRYCLQEKRWRVDYGAHFERTLLAVPYKAKDTPSSASDFAHPEVLLSLTCLSWYNYGLEDEDIKRAFYLVSSTENPDDEYRKWVAGIQNIPAHLQSLQGVNVENAEEFTAVISPMFRFNKAIIDFCLENFVFPQFAKRNPFKLTSSGWDIVEMKPNLTSGFSGTNDNKYLLPLSIEQHDLESHAHTNALVLNYLLATENNHFIRAAIPRTKEKMSVEELLNTVVEQNPPISVLLDVGAQVLELGNQEVAKEWLHRAARADPEKWQAAIFFNSKDEICVIDRVGRVELLMTSNFARQMESCLCYLDDAHTRGTDLQFPLHSRALVTLGPRTTKDRLIQGAMRMRKLGKGHSVVFCAPPDIESKILAISNKPRVENVDILKWVLRETCHQTKKNASLWAAQGGNYVERKLAQNDYDLRHDWKLLRDRLFEPERLSLQDLYTVKIGPQESFVSRLSRLNISTQEDIVKIRTHCEMFDIENFDEMNGELDEEHEREVEQEIETEREVQRPPPAKPHLHSTNSDVKKFIRKGTLPKQWASAGIFPAIDSLRHTSFWKSVRTGSWSTRLLVSLDFARTVDMLTSMEVKGRLDFQDEFIRPVCYILSLNKSQRRKAALLMVSPFEVNELIDEIKSSKFVHLHVYMPKVTKSMNSFENLKSMNIGKTYSSKWCVPAVLMDQLNLFAGQLYFRHRIAYLRTAEWLSLRTPETHPNAYWEEDGFVPPGQRRLKPDANGEVHEFKSTFNKSPVECIQKLVSMRRKGFRYEPTHLGQLLHGKLIPADEFDEEDSELELMFNEDDAVSAEEDDDEDENDRDIKEELDPFGFSAETRRNQVQVDEEMEDADGIEEDAEGEPADSEDDSLSRVKTEPPNDEYEYGYGEEDRDVSQEYSSDSGHVGHSRSARAAYLESESDDDPEDPDEDMGGNLDVDSGRDSEMTSDW
ncbi:hypothetical protein TWF694_002004 [Orbilia ellipsospora]|uniref:ubiquitinyl hydrolase 1 n=1 Tax=Orbilia ellipsospora TaxID=2528407 RepID=A0AAV9X4K9_9PEZI